MSIIDYENLVKEIEEKEIGGITKLEIVSHLLGFENYNRLSEENKTKLLDFLYSYWIENDFIEHTLFDYVYSIMCSSSLGFLDIVSKINELDYKTFVDIIEEKEIF